MEHAQMRQNADFLPHNFPSHSRENLSGQVMSSNSSHPQNLPQLLPQAREFFDAQMRVNATRFLPPQRAYVNDVVKPSSNPPPQSQNIPENGAGYQPQLDNAANCNPNLAPPNGNHPNDNAASNVNTQVCSGDPAPPPPPQAASPVHFALRPMSPIRFFRDEANANANLPNFYRENDNIPDRDVSLREQDVDTEAFWQQLMSSRQNQQDGARNMGYVDRQVYPTQQPAQQPSNPDNVLNRVPGDFLPVQTQSVHQGHRDHPQNAYGGSYSNGGFDYGGYGNGAYRDGYANRFDDPRNWNTEERMNVDQRRWREENGGGGGGGGGVGERTVGAQRNPADRILVDQRQWEEEDVRSERSVISASDFFAPGETELQMQSSYESELRSHFGMSGAKALKPFPFPPRVEIPFLWGQSQHAANKIQPAASRSCSINQASKPSDSKTSISSKTSNREERQDVYPSNREERHDMYPSNREERQVYPSNREERQNVYPSNREERQDVYPSNREDRRDVYPSNREDRRDVYPSNKEERRDIYPNPWASADYLGERNWNASPEISTVDHLCSTAGPTRNAVNTNNIVQNRVSSKNMKAGAVAQPANWSQNQLRASRSQYQILPQNSGNGDLMSEVKQERLEDDERGMFKMPQQKRNTSKPTSNNNKTIDEQARNGQEGGKVRATLSEQGNKAVKPSKGGKSVHWAQSADDSWQQLNIDPGRSRGTTHLPSSSNQDDDPSWLQPPDMPPLDLDQSLMDDMDADHRPMRDSQRDKGGGGGGGGGRRYDGSSRNEQAGGFEERLSSFLEMPDLGNATDSLNASTPQVMVVWFIQVNVQMDGNKIRPRLKNLPYKIRQV
jgi:hypothetical protein